MFSCRSCKNLEKEVEYLKSLVDRLLESRGIPAPIIEKEETGKTGIPPSELPKLEPEEEVEVFGQ